MNYYKYVLTYNKYSIINLVWMRRDFSPLGWGREGKELFPH